MPKKETKILVIILLLADVISIGAFIFLFSFTKGLISESVSNGNDIKAELAKEDTIILMKDDITLGKMYQDKLMGYAIPAGGTVDLIKALEILVSNTGLKSDIKVVASEPYDKGNLLGLELVRINMDVTGEWKNVQFFLTSLENYPLKISVKKVSLSKFSDFNVNGKNIPQWAGNFEFTVVKIKDTK